MNIMFDPKHHVPNPFKDLKQYKKQTNKQTVELKSCLQVSAEVDLSCDELLSAFAIGVNTSTRVFFPNMLLFFPLLFISSISATSKMYCI